jgi:hypothetical protein
MDLFGLVPQVTRARGWRLYGGGRRFVDLWQGGGTAILGHKSSGLVRSLKDAAERGLFMPLPHVQGARFIKALEKLFPGMAFRVYADWSEFPDWKCLPVWRPFRPALVSTAVPDASDTGVSVTGARWHWKGVEKGTGVYGTSVFRPVLPFPLGPAVIVCGKEEEADFPPSSCVPPVILAMAARACYSLLASPERGVMPFRRIKEVFAEGGSAGGWRLEGIYIWREETAAEDWEAVFRRFLDGGFLLPPAPSGPLIIPAELSRGEEAALARLLLETSARSV